MPTTKSRARGAKRAATATPGAPAKVDVHKEHAAEYVTPRTPAMVDVGPATYLAIDGTGEPGGAEFSAAVGGLYSVAYTIKMSSKAAGRDFTVSKLEALWWCDTDSARFVDTPREKWHWKLLIRIPAFVTASAVKAGIESAIAKGKAPTARSVRREVITEGRCVQMLHVGPYASEPASIALMRKAADDAGVRLTGRHHEIYLSDPGRTAPEKLRTILRMPVG